MNKTLFFVIYAAVGLVVVIAAVYFLRPPRGRIGKFIYGGVPLPPPDWQDREPSPISGPPSRESEPPCPQDVEGVRLKAALAALSAIIEAKGGIVGEIAPQLAVGEALRVADVFVKQWFNLETKTPKPCAKTNPATP